MTARANDRGSVHVGLLWRGDVGEPAPKPADTRLRRIFEEFERLGACAEPVVYAEEVEDEIRERLRGMDAVLVWVDPIVRGRERGRLDELLREVAASGVFVSAHPDVIQKMGTKEVLHKTRAMSWSTDVHVYRDAAGLRSGLERLLREDGPQVVKQDRGSSGNGVWRVELSPNAASGGLLVRVQGGERGATAEEMSLERFAELRAPYFGAFGGTGCFVVQRYAGRLAEGMVRCYMVQDKVAGFGQQFVTALAPVAVGEAAPDPSPRQ